jgi:hypothetical protein
MGPDGLDFWIGEWDVSWDGGGGINRVSRELGGRVVVERFQPDPPERFAGMSVSVFDEQVGTWRQTWVDSDGNHWTFVGSSEAGDAVFATSGPVDREQLFKRMVFSDIASDGFRWRWESSPDGVVWTERWAIVYRRRPAEASIA